MPERKSRSLLRSRLEARRTDLERMLLAKAVAVADPHAVADPVYAESLQRALSVAVDFALATIDSGAVDYPPIPVELLAQARMAARNGIDLDVVLRRYFAGYSSLTSMAIEEAGRNGLLPEDVHRMMTASSSHFERLIAAIGDEHRRESQARTSSLNDRRVAQVRALLEGEPVETAELSYELDAWHLGFVAAGPAATEHLRDIARRADRRLLVVSNPEGSVFAWHGSRRRPDPAIWTDSLQARGDRPLVVAVGEPARGEAGWRLTHRQAAAAFPIALRLGLGFARYADVGLTASVLRDDTLTQSLHSLYVRPWAGKRDAETLRDTLRAYFAAAQNVSSAAMALGVKRHTVTNRLRRIEERLGRPLADCSVELALALRVETVAGMAK